MQIDFYPLFSTSTIVIISIVRALRVPALLNHILACMYETCIFFHAGCTKYVSIETSSIIIIYLYLLALGLAQIELLVGIVRQSCVCMQVFLSMQI
jgi:hypothetical protein